jgi:hypothetical protein
LGGIAKNHPPQNHKNVGFILINEKTNFKKKSQFFIGSQEPSPLIS